MSVNREEVVNAYRYILGRYPESEVAVDNHAKTATNFESLRLTMLKSQEFARNYEKLACGLPGKVIKGKDLAISLCEINGHEFFWCGASQANDTLNEYVKCGQTYLGGGIAPSGPARGWLFFGYRCQYRRHQSGFGCLRLEGLCG